MNEITVLSALSASVLITATPILLAALGELVVEKAGVLNLGVEGMMLVGAVCGFAGSYMYNNTVGIVWSIVGAVLVSLIFAFLTQILMTNQIATGLALTIFGVGLSALIGKNFVGVRIDQIQKIKIPILGDMPFFGKFLFHHDIIVFMSPFLAGAIYYVVFKTKWGLILRSVGENHDAAHALGYNVVKIRFFAIMFGAGMAGLAGAYLSMVYTPHWSENMTAGKGWIALALVVFSAWRPGRLVAGAYLFGFILIMQLFLQGLGVAVSPQLLSMTPYLFTIGILILISRDRVKLRLCLPGSLGKLFVRN